MRTAIKAKGDDGNVSFPNLYLAKTTLHIVNTVNIKATWIEYSKPTAAPMEAMSFIAPPPIPSSPVIFLYIDAAIKKNNSNTTIPDMWDNQ